MVVDEELCDAVLKIIQPLSQQDLHKEITEQVCRLIDGKHASIFGYEKDALKRLHTTTPMLHAVIPRKNGLTACTFRKRKAYIRTMVDGKRTYPMFGKLRVGSGIFFPIHDNKKTLTVISVFSKIDDRKVKEKVKRHGEKKYKSGFYNQ